MKKKVHGGMNSRGAAVLVAGALSALSQRVTPAQLPIPCAAGACGSGATAPAGFVTSGKATGVQSGNSLTINQTSDKATLNWQSFNVSADGKVTFVQPSATSVALNRIFQGSPSAIFGNVSANGQIYLVNPNGFVFGKGATVNAAGLIASSLGISDDVFNVGLLAPQVLQGALPGGIKAALSGEVPLGTDGNPLPGADPSTVSINVQNGAQLSTPGGRLLLAAPIVQNGGSLSASDGQVILAAGQQVYLAASSSSSLRGLVVEVDTLGAAPGTPQSWSASNLPGGLISTPRGNTTLVGLAVNQDGRISATTSVAANGTVRLEAGNQAAIGGGGAVPFTLASQFGGTVELGPQSSIEILPEVGSSATAVKDQLQPQSEVDLAGQAILMHGGSIHAPNGNLNVIASAAPVNGVATDGNPLARIRVDSGTSIDVSGSTAELPMSTNLLAIQLRANELADDPTQRNGALRGQTVYVDARVGSPLISAAAFSSAVNAVPESIAQRTTAGGSVTFKSEGDVVVQQGATINVSGGWTTYDGGNLQTTLLAGKNGGLYDIGTANPLLTYSGVVNPTFTQTFNKWGVQDIVATPGLSHYESGYVQGAQAGKISIAAPSLVLAGTFVGHAVNGARQRDGSATVSGGQLVIGLAGGLNSAATSANLDFLAPSISFATQAFPIVVSDDAPLPPQTAQLPVDYLAAGGFTSTKIYSNGTVTVPAGVPLNLNPGGSLLVQAAHVNVLSDITAPGGSIQLQNALTVDAGDPSISRLGIHIGDGVVFDVRGQWTNDSQALLGNSVGTGQILKDGGTINIGAPVGDLTTLLCCELVIGNDVALRASGGGWLQSNGTVTGGKGGSISLGSGPFGAALQVGSGVALDAFGVNGAKGGSFTLTAPRILVEGQSATWADAQRVDDLAPSGGTAPGGVFKVGTSLFNGDGFSSVTLLANGAVPVNAPNTDILTVQTGTTITALTQNLQLQGGYELAPTGAPLSGFTQIETLPLAARTPESITLSVAPQSADTSFTHVGLLDVQTGASILADPKASISLNGVGGIYVDGTLRAPAGAISLHILSPKASPDPGYLPDLSIELGSHSVLDVSGAFVPALNSEGLLLGSVLPGGTINLLADRGSVIADGSVPAAGGAPAAPGSQINISGTSAALDVQSSQGASPYVRYTVPSAGGSLIVHAPETISLLGNFEARAGSGNYGAPAAGSLEVDLTRSELFFNSPGTLPPQLPFPTGPRIIELVSDTTGLGPSTPSSGQAVLGISQLAASGIDSLRLEAGDEILLSSSLPLTLARQLILDAPAIAVGPGLNASFKTNYAELGYTINAPSTAVPVAGTGTLSIDAQQIDLIGSFVLQNIGTAKLTSAGDIMLRSVFNASPGKSGPAQLGNLALDGNLVLSAARIYPATDSPFSIATVHNPIDPSTKVDSVTINQSAPSPGTPLSAGGSMRISADQITDSGTLFAPFGSIALIANSSLNVEPGSVTSVSGAGMSIPFGSTLLGGQQWTYTINTPGGSNVSTVTNIPDRAVTLTAPTLHVAPGATVNLTGGGDLYAYEWVPGTGGSKDALGQDSSTGQIVTPGLYAVLPSMRGQYAPFDSQEGFGSGLTPGAGIYLSGGAGLAAGIYPLLPARDALVPGAYLVQVQSGYSNIVPGQQAALQDKTPVIAGYLTFGTTGLHSGGYQGVAVWPGTYGQSLAQYTVSNASTYFAAAAAAAAAPRPALPVDAGSLSIAVLNGLDFQGSVLGNLPGSPGFSSKVDISAPQLEITAPGASGGGTSIAGTVIQSWKAGQVILGGHPSTDGTSVDVMSNTVTIDRGAQVSADQVIVVANQSIDVQGTMLSTSATGGGTAPSVLPVNNSISLTSTNAAGVTTNNTGAALLAVSDLSLPIVQRTGGGTGGATISVEQGATIGSLGALSVDGPGGVSLAGNLSGAHASWSLASQTIGFVGAGSSTDSLQINAGVLADLQSAAAVRLASDGAINFYTPVLLGDSSTSLAPTLNALTLSATALVNQGGAGASIFGAKTLTLEAAGSAAATPAPTPVGSLSFVGSEIDIGPGNVAIAGFQDTTLKAGSEVVGQKIGGVSTGGDLTITAPVLTVLGGAKTAFMSTGTLTVNMPVQGSAAPSLANSLGGEIDLSANAVQMSGNVAAPAGIIRVQSAQDINLSDGAVLDAGGRIVTIGSHAFGAEGGYVYLAAAGNLAMATGSSVNVSGAGDAPAGIVNLSAGGAADLLAGFSGHAGTGAQGGSFTISANRLTEGLTPLANALQTGGFTAVDSVRVHTGDLSLAAGSTLAANQLTLVTDTGKVDIGGTLTAANTDLRGKIGLFGGTGVTLDPTAVVRADTVGGAGIGGEIELGTMTGGNIMLGAGSTLSAAGSNSKGTLLVRAPIVGNGIAVTNNGADFSGLGQIVVEPIIDMPIGTTLTTANLKTIETSVNTTMATLAPAIQQSLNPSGSLPLVVRAAVDLQQSGSLTISSALNLGPTIDPRSSNVTNPGWRPGGEPVDLTFRVGGSINVQSTISDGFTVTPGRGGKPATLSLTACSASICTPDEMLSASIGLVAGADQGSPDPLATVAGSAANLNLGTSTAGTPSSNGIVRTGTGDINLVASGNIVFNNASQVYTAGLPGVATTTVGTSKFSFPTQGGAVRLGADGDIVGSPVRQSVTAWQVREGGTLPSGTVIPTQWGVDLNQFGWNVGSLGGGDVSVTARGSITTLSAAAADSYSNSAAGNTPTHYSSGGLAVTAGGDVGSGQFFIADGASLLRAGGAFSAAQQITNGTTGVTTNIGSLIAMNDAQISVEARNGIVIEAVINPTAISQITPTNPPSFFFTYGSDSSLVLQSTNNDVSLLQNGDAQGALMGPIAASTISSVQVLPATLIMRALQHDLNTPVATLYPSAQGQLELVAGNDVLSAGRLVMSDAIIADIPTAQSPSQGPQNTGNITTETFLSSAHSNDSVPALVVAGRDAVSLNLYVPKATDIMAGRDIVNLNFFGENLNPGDLTLASAGRDFIDNATAGAVGIQMGGPGRLDVLAGRNVDLGSSLGIATVGNTANPNLPTAAGAAVTVLAGQRQAPDYADFLTKVIAPDTTNQGVLTTYVESLTGQTGLSYASAANEFMNLSTDQRRPLFDKIFFDQLLISGRQANTDPKAGFSLGYAAIDALFPNSRTATATGPSSDSGDILLSFSRIYTTNGGTISLLAPGGHLDVGLANPPSSLASRPASQLGIVAEGPGDVDIYSKGDVNVNSSRIFTLGGGNILIWSDEGSIDAGRGSKSSVSAPPPEVLVDSSGNVSLSFSGAVAGSGIRTIQVDPTVNPGNVDLIAPEGTVNAGDAGIGAAGNINIAAQHVIGLDNIQFGGNSTGVPAQVSSIGVSLSGASNSASSASNASANAASGAGAEKESASPLAQTALSWLDVFVTGLGEDNCKQDDAECLKRQKIGAK